MFGLFSCLKRDWRDKMFCLSASANTNIRPFDTPSLLQLKTQIKALNVLAGFFSKSKISFSCILARLLFEISLRQSDAWCCLLCLESTKNTLMCGCFSLKSQNEDSDVPARLLSMTDLLADHNLSFCLSVDIDISDFRFLLASASKIHEHEERCFVSSFVQSLCSG